MSLVALRLSLVSCHRFDASAELRLTIYLLLDHPHRGRSPKFNPQRVGLTHVMDNEDVIQIVKKSTN